jgi:hypothetical protein
MEFREIDGVQDNRWTPGNWMEFRELDGVQGNRWSSGN